MSVCSLKNKYPQELMLDKIVLCLNKKLITDAITERNNKFFTPNEFNHALKDLINRKYVLYMHLNISSSSYHH